MKELTWNETLSVQIDEIDADHRKLMGLYNILRNSVADGDAPNYIEAVLDELVSCTDWHFKHEERLMLKYGYKDYAEHKSEHRELMETVRKFQQDLLKEGKPVMSEDVKFLEDWLTGHILCTDMHLGSYLCDVM